VKGMIAGRRSRHRPGFVERFDAWSRALTSYAE